MNATIDIKTPSGKSLEGFPVTCEKFIDIWSMRGGNNRFRISPDDIEKSNTIQLHKGDRIIIEIV